jgi:hypothetical protein
MLYQDESKDWGLAVVKNKTLWIGASKFSKGGRSEFEFE